MTTDNGSGPLMTNHRKDAGLRVRVLGLAKRLAPLLEDDLAPDAAGTTALLWASLLVEAEEHDLQGKAARTIRRSRRSRTNRALPTLPILAREHPGIPARDLIARFLDRLPPSTSWTPAVRAPRVMDERRQASLASLHRLRQAGVDVSLLRTQLRLSPTQRLEAMLRLNAFTHDLVHAARLSDPARL
ncbi:MAG TPA: hypothetical protein VIJ28_10310 [Chloroflexota bacterium]|jgi:hypothetical protein